LALVSSTAPRVGTCATGAAIVDALSFGTTVCTIFDSATLSSTTALLRGLQGCGWTHGQADDFEVGSPAPRNTATPAHACITSPTGSGSASPSSVPAGGQTLLTVGLTPGAAPTSTGLVVTCDLGAIGGPAAQSFVDDGTH